MSSYRMHPLLPDQYSIDGDEVHRPGDNTAHVLSGPVAHVPQSMCIPCYAALTAMSCPATAKAALLLMNAYVTFVHPPDYDHCLPKACMRCSAGCQWPSTRSKHALTQPGIVRAAGAR